MSSYVYLQTYRAWGVHCTVYQWNIYSDKRKLFLIENWKGSKKKKSLHFEISEKFNKKKVWKIFTSKK